MTRNKRNIFSLKKDKRYVRPNGLHVRSNLVPGLTYDRLIGKSYLQACSVMGAWMSLRVGAHGWVAGIASHGSVLLSRGWLITVEVPGHPGHPPSTQLDAVVNLNYSHKIALTL